MEKKKIVSIEDKIPKLKQARKKKANRRLAFYLMLFAVLISIIIYLQSPLSNVNEVEIKGNLVVDKELIQSSSGISEKTNIWTVNKSKLTDIIESSPYVKTAVVKKQLPRKIMIEVEEYKIVGYIQTEKKIRAVLESGQIIDSKANDYGAWQAPILNEFKEKDYVARLAKELNELPIYLFDSISEITWVPTKNNKNKIELYMNDGYIVKTTIRDFANNMKAYPSIVSQIEPGKEGVIHIGTGSYFEEKKQSK